MEKKFIIFGVIYATHGVRGLVKVKNLTNITSDIFSYKLYLKDYNNLYKLIKIRIQKRFAEHFFCSISNVDSLNLAERYKGEYLYVNSTDIKLDKNEFIASDLIGVKIYTQNQCFFGVVINTNNFGASDIIEVSLKHGKKKMYPFIKSIFKYVNKEKITVSNEIKNF